MEIKIERLLVLSLLTAVVTTGGLTQADLVAHWKLDETSGSIAVDSSGNGYNGTLYGDPVWTKGKRDGALKFDGKDDYVDLPIGSIIESLTDSTFSIWVNFSNTGGTWQRIFDFGNDTSEYMFLSPRIEAIGPMRFAITTTSNANGSQIDTSGTLQTDWHQVVIVINGIKKRIQLYLDSDYIVQDSTKFIPADLGNTTQNWLGRSRWANDAYFNGLLDDFRIYNHAMRPNEIAILYSKSFFPPSHILSQAVQDIEIFLKKQNPQKAIEFIEEMIDEYREWTKADESGLAQKLLSSELYYYLVKAEVAASVSKENLMSAYERAIQSDGLLPPQLGDVLLWLYNNLDEEDYEYMIQSTIKSNGYYLKEVVTQAELMIQEQKYKAAIRFLETNLILYSRWQGGHPRINLATEQTLPEIYFKLAQAKQAVGSSQEEIAEAYFMAFHPSSFDYISEWTTALIWLLENDFAEEYAKAVHLFMKDPDTKEGFINVTVQLCNHFQSKNDWNTFQRFLDTLFTDTEQDSEWAILIKSCIGDKPDRWYKAFHTYVQSKPRLEFKIACSTAKKYVADKKFKEASELYRIILDCCGPENDKGSYEFQLCKCLFEGRQYQEAIGSLEHFIITYKATHRSLVKEAMLMKGRALIQLAETEKAIDALFTLMIEYPDNENAPEINFIIGYCYMLQSKFKEATEAFDLVVKDYPESSYANQARLSLSRIKNMTE